ncbi:MAG: YceI family protein [Bdellovibrio sp.]|nr:YceI family protein [Bdellovibrio sp.]
MFFILLLGPVGTFAQEATEGIGFCSEYVAQKTMGFISDSEVVGKSCSGTFWIKKISGGKFVVSAVIPVGSFDSGIHKRDVDIERLFTSSSSKGLLRFDSKELDATFLEQLKSGSAELPGVLTLKDVSRNVRFEVQLDSENKRILATLETKLTDFDLEPPRVLGGFIAKVHPDFKIRVNVDAKVLSDFNLQE